MADVDENITAVRYCRNCTRPFAETPQVLQSAQAFCSKECMTDADGWPRCHECTKRLSDAGVRRGGRYCSKPCYRKARGRYETYMQKNKEYNAQHAERVRADKWAEREAEP